MTLTKHHLLKYLSTVPGEIDVFFSDMSQKFKSLRWWLKKDQDGGFSYRTCKIMTCHGSSDCFRCSGSSYIWSHSKVVNKIRLILTSRQIISYLSFGVMEYVLSQHPLSLNEEYKFQRRLSTVKLFLKSIQSDYILCSTLLNYIETKYPDIYLLLG
jgi:hypothetical protein